MSASTTDFNSQPLNFTERAANELSRAKSKIDIDELAATQALREAITRQLSEILVGFGKRAHLHGYVVPDGEVAHPFEFPEHRKFYDSYRRTEYVCYLVSILLLAAQTWLTLSYDVWVKVAIVLVGFLLVSILFPAVIWTAFNVVQKEKDSVKPVKGIFIGAAVLALAGVIAFALTRSTAESTGAWVMVYNNALVAAELGFAICGACAHVMKKFYEWSILATSTYTSLEQELGAKSARIAELEQRLVTPAGR